MHASSSARFELSPLYWLDCVRHESQWQKDNRQKPKRSHYLRFSVIKKSTSAANGEMTFEATTICIDLMKNLEEVLKRLTDCALMYHFIPTTDTIKQSTVITTYQL
jgi:hypothetical protein